MLKVYINDKPSFTTSEVTQAIEAIESAIKVKDVHAKLLTPLSKSIILTMKAQHELETLGDKEKAKQTYDDALAQALQTFPHNHPFVMKIFQKMQALWTRPSVKRRNDSLISLRRLDEWVPHRQCLNSHGLERWLAFYLVRQQN